MGLFQSQTFVPLEEILSPTDETIIKIVELLHENQYLLINLDHETKSQLDALKRNGIAFFNQSSDYKESFKYDMFQKDQKIQQSQGYVEIKDVREYIKFIGKDFEKAPEEFKHLEKLYHKSISILFKIFEILSLHEKKLFLKELPEAVKGLKDEKSSLSCIHYYKPKVEQPTIVSEPHEDTGILTGIFLSNVPGLQIWNKKEEKYFVIEKYVKEDTFVVIMGKKTSLFCQGFLEETLHQVIIDGKNERFSIVCMLDVQ